MPTAFALPEDRSSKSAPALIADDERHFARIGTALTATVAALDERLARVRALPARDGEAALERDLEVRRLSARRRTLERYTLDACLGRIVTVGGDATRIGRIGLTDADGDRLLVDWRAPAAEPFFAATRAHPQGLATRRRYRWTGGRVSDYWDEAFTAEAEESAALDDESAFIASLGAARSARMRDVLATVQADQDAIIRTGADGTLVVDGGPGTGKTVVALHRVAYLLYADPRLAPGRGGVLFIGPNDAYLAYVEDVLPSLGEESVRMATLADLLPEGRTAEPESDPRIADLKGALDADAVVEAIVRRARRVPAEPVAVRTPWGEVVLHDADWEEAFAAPEPGIPHDDAREQVWAALGEIVRDAVGTTAPEHLVARALAHDADLTAAFDRAWPLLDPDGAVAALWSTPAFLASCAPQLTAEEVALLQRDDPRAWTTSDLPILDAARHRIGDPSASLRRPRRAAERAAEQEVRDRVADDLIAADDGDLRLMSMLRGQDARNALGGWDDDEEAADVLAGPFAHIVVDEAQELTDAQWRMLVRRCPSRSVTVVGDRAQARRGFAESWEERLARVGLRRASVASLSVNYRTPEEVMEVAEPVIRGALPDANVPRSVRRSGIPVRRGRTDELEGILEDWLADRPEGIACVIGMPGFADRPRVRALRAEDAKGLEFDLVVIVRPEELAPVDRYVAMTRSTAELVLLDTLDG